MNKEKFRKARQQIEVYLTEDSLKAIETETNPETKDLLKWVIKALDALAEDESQDRDIREEIG